MDLIKKIERSLPWSFLGFLVAVVFGLFGIYSVFFYSKAPDLRAEIISSSPVLSIRENVQNLDILFEGQNIRQSHQLLTLISLKLVNRGNMAVKPGDFDPRDLPTILVKNGNIVKSDILETSDEYLAKVFSETTISSDHIVFTPFILEPGNFISIKLLVLHSDSVQPKIEMKGKIANIAVIPVVLSTELQSPTEVSLAFSGDNQVHFIRFMSYGLGTFMVIIALLVLFALIKGKVERNRLNKGKLIVEERVKEFLSKLDNRSKPLLEQIAHKLLADEIEFIGYRIRHYIKNINANEEANAEMYLARLFALLRERGVNVDDKYFQENPYMLKQLLALLELISLIDDF